MIEKVIQETLRCKILLGRSRIRREDVNKKKKNISNIFVEERENLD